MDIYAFFCITISIFVLSKWWKHQRVKWYRRNEFKVIPNNIRTQIKPDVKDLEKEVDNQKKKDIEALKKQGYTDELIAIILPTINNGQ